jgi:hypothetical protein
MESIWGDFIAMEELEVFTDISEDKILYGKFRDIYIPLINKKIIYNSLDFYSPTSIKGKIYKTIVRLGIKLFNIRVNIKEYKEISINDYIEFELKMIPGYRYCSVYKREDNINKDYIIKIMDENGKNLGYAKYPRFNNKKEFVFKEVRSLNYVNTLNLKYGVVPKVLLFNKEKSIYIQSTKDNLKNDNGNLSEKHIDFLCELYKKTNRTYKFKDSRAYNQLINVSKKTNNQDILTLSSKILDYLNLEKIQYCYSHGDFYCPNIKLYKNLVFVYDWECGRENTLYFDIFHYLVNIEMFRNKKNKELIVDNIVYDNKFLEVFEVKNNIDKSIRKPMFILYLYEIIYDFHINMGLEKSSDGTLKNYIEALYIILNRS